ncbi:unnamed protein product [Toxocara canis]|uniref:Ricin B-type lectin domain-containing protein n=1 Tax=Toxocara canis TaxID=6265 RepID=A0A183V5K0_TOXCA|nr:unnamed protein product [Toxocara canis]
MDNASVYVTEDCRFESWRGRNIVHGYLSNNQSFVTSCKPLLASQHFLTRWFTFKKHQYRPLLNEPCFAQRPPGAMVIASVYVTEDCRFESWRGRKMEHWWIPFQ